MNAQLKKPRFVGYGHGERISEHNILKIKTLVGISMFQLHVTVIRSIIV